MEEDKKTPDTFINRITAAFREKGYTLKVHEAFNDPRILHATKDIVNGRLTIKAGTSAMISLPVEIEWFTPQRVAEACTAVEIELGQSHVTIIPPQTCMTKIEIHAKQGIIIDIPRIVRAFLNAIGMRATIRRVQHGFYGCDACLETRTPRYYLFDLGEGDQRALCPACAKHRIASGRATPASIGEIYEVA